MVFSPKTKKIFTEEEKKLFAIICKYGVYNFYFLNNEKKNFKHKTSLLR